MATKQATAGKKRLAPDFSGVPGTLVKMPDFKLEFEARKARVSPYDAPLKELVKGAASDHVLMFGDVRARTSVTARAKKLGLKVLFAENSGKLYVKFAGYQPDSEPFKELARERILDVIETNPRNEVQIAVELRRQGLPELDAQLVATMLRQMEQDGLTKRAGDGTWRKK